MKTLTWKDAEALGEALASAHPGTDPLKLRFTELHALVTALPGFADDPQASSERLLEAILLAWLEAKD